MAKKVANLSSNIEIKSCEEEFSSQISSGWDGEGGARKPTSHEASHRQGSNSIRSKS